MKDQTFGLGIGNYYGEVTVRIGGEKCYLELENWDGTCDKEISKELAAMLVMELFDK